MEKSQRIALFSVLLNIFLFTVKYFGALYSGSMGLKAEAFHSLTDVVASLSIFFGLKISSRKTRKFPYGLYKVENLISLFIAVAIYFAAYEIVRDAVEGHAFYLFRPWIAVYALIIGIAVAFGFSRYEGKVGKKISSPSLIADSKHIGVDLFAMGIVIVGIVSSFFGLNLDRYASIVVAIFICYAGYEILVDSLRVLLDASLDYDTLSLAEKIIREEPQVSDIVNLKGRNSGRFKFIEAEIIIKTHNFDRAHYIATKIERNIKSKIKNVDEVLIHYEPLKKKVFVYCFPSNTKIESVSELENVEISKHFGEAGYFLLTSVDIEKKELIDLKALENPFKNLERKKGIFVAEYLVKNDIDVLVTVENLENKGPYYVLSNAGVEIIYVKQRKIPEVLKEMGLHAQ